MNARNSYILEISQRSIDTKKAFFGDEQCVADLNKAADFMVSALHANRKIMFCGNGGSAADSQHLAAELVARFEKNRAAMAAIALTVDTSAITAIANDFDYSKIFSRQVEALGNAGDVLIAISTSGTSKNVVAAVNAAKAKGVICIGMTGTGGGALATLCDVCLKVPSSEVARIQETHILLGHILCGIVESEALKI